MRFGVDAPPTGTLVHDQCGGWEDDLMRAAVIYAPKDIRIEEVPDPTLVEPTDAIVRVTHACICGSDLWAYQGWPAGRRR
jgi:D-arabinose 1-dehydrogenase-like Zn-dependent alcohol dehydrogenase